MDDFLPDLNVCLPKIFGFLSVAIRAHLRVDGEFDDEGLLEDGAVQNFLLDGQFHFDAPDGNGGRCGEEANNFEAS